MSLRKRSSTAVLVCGAVSLAFGLSARLHSAADGQSFATLYPGFSQQLFAVVSSFQSPFGYLGGVAVLQSGDVVAAECVSSGARLHRFSAASPIAGSTLHTDTPMMSDAGCGIVVHPNGYLYSNRDAAPGIVKIDPNSGATAALMGPAGNALGLAVDPKTEDIVYAGHDCRAGVYGPTCTLYEVNPKTAAVSTLAVFNSTDIGYVGGIYFDPSGNYIFLNNRYPGPSLVILTRSGAVVQNIPLPFGIDSTGIAFHAQDEFVVTNNTDGTMTLFRFDKSDYSQAPTQEFFAAGGFRGDLTQVGPDGCLYATQAGTRFDDYSESTANSIVRICNAKAPFVPPAGIHINRAPSANLRVALVGPSDVTAGNAFAYSVNATNTGADAADQPVITTALPAHSTFDFLQVSPGWTCTAPEAGKQGSIACTKTSMDVNETATLTVAVHVDCLGSAPPNFALTAGITSATDDPDRSDNSALLAPTVTVIPLAISNITLSESVLWPPNHRTVDVAVNYTVTGACGGTASTKLKLQANEPVGAGLGVLDKHHVRVEATRAGSGDGRVYTVTIVATDAGRATTAQTQIVVPHDMR